MPQKPEAGSGSVRDRLLAAGKTLFAKQGYDNASTSSVARAAGTSESQLVKHFGGKQGLLRAIFDVGWQSISDRIDAALPYAQDPASKLSVLAQTVSQALEADPELKLLFLLEGRRLRADQTEPAISQGFLQHIERIDAVLAELYAAGRLKPGVHPQAVRSALMGMMEGLMRDHFLGERGGFPADYPLSDLPILLGLVMQAVLRK